MLCLANLRDLHGDAVETATLARDLLAPIATQLSGDPSDVHHRCVFGRYLGFFRNPDGLRDDLAPFGDVEAVAVSELLQNAVVVFRAEASAGVALRRQAETSKGWFTVVPPLDAALPRYTFIDRDIIEAKLFPAAASTRTPPPVPRPLRPLFCFKHSPDEKWPLPCDGEPGTVRFMPDRASLIYGPARRPDGHLWMDGDLVFYLDKGARVDHVSIRVVRLPAGKYCADLPTFVPDGPPLSC